CSALSQQHNSVLPTFPTRRSSDLRRSRGNKHQLAWLADASPPLPMVAVGDELPLPLPIAFTYGLPSARKTQRRADFLQSSPDERSEEHTSELQSPDHLL